MRKLSRKSFVYAFVLVLSLIIIALVSGCGVQDQEPQIELPVFERPPQQIVIVEPPQRPVTVSSIEIIVEQTTMLAGTRFVPIVNVYPEDAEDRSYTLRSGDERLMRPARGAWMTFAPGRAELIATAAGGVSARLVITITQPVESISLETEDITIGVGETLPLVYTVLPENAADRSVRFVSSDESVVTVSQSGVITAVSKGEAAVDVITSCGNFVATAEITVVVPVEIVTLTIARSHLAIGDSLDVDIAVYPEEAAEIEISLTASNANISISDNTITGVSAGPVTITASAPNGVYAEFEMFVVDLEFFAREVLRLTNEIRFNYNLLGFGQNAALTAAAEVRARESAVVFSHTRPDGRGPFTAFTENDVIFTRAAENLAAGQTTPEQAVNGWMNSPGHRANIVNADLAQLGVAVYMTDAGRLYWVQTFTD